VTKRPTVLIVDDEIIIARELEARLKGMGYDVAGIASSGAEAIRLAAETRPSLVLMDIVLKGDLDGIEAANEIVRHERVPIIFVTAYADEATLARAKVVEPFGYIVKPFSERELNANIEMALYRHASENRVRKLERWFAAAVDDTADAVVATDTEGVITVFNPAAEAIIGWTRDEAIGRNVHEVVRIVDGSGRAVALDASDGPVVQLANGIRLIDRSGRSVTVESTTSCVRDPEGRPSGFVSMIRDVSGRRQAALVALSSDIALASAHAVRLDGMLQMCAESMVRNLGAAFARIWTVDESGTTLELKASAGMYTHLDGAHGRVPIGQFKIGLIAEERQPHTTNDVLNDSRVSDHEWARREGMVAFAGHPLIVENRLLGVMAMFSRQPFKESVQEVLASIASAVAVGIERKRAEAERDRLMELLEVQVERMPLAYILFDAENRVLEWNPGAERLFGYRKQEMLGHDPFDLLVPPSSQEHARDVVHRLQTGDMFAHSVNDNVTKDGRTITCEWLNTPLWGEDGKVNGIVSIAQDMSERQSLKGQLLRAEQRLERVVASSPAVLYTLEGSDADSLLLTWISENVTEMMGYPMDDVLVPTWWHDRVHPDDLPRVMAEIEAGLTAHGQSSQEYRFRHHDGGYRWVRSEMRLARDASGSPLSIVGSWSDIDRRKQLEDQFRQAQKMEVVGQLAGGVAHDFNNLLTVISGYSQLLLSAGGMDEQKTRLVQEISKAGARAATLTRQLLAFSRKQVLEPRILDLNVLIADHEKMLRRLIGEDVVLSTALGPGLKRTKADPGQLEQVIMNLAVNARDAMPGGGKLTIETRNTELDETYARAHHDVKPGPYVLLSVSDTGCGIPPEVMSHIFEPFYTTKEQGKGTGLGLATVYGIVKQSGGHVSVYSEPGIGTTFRIYLPPVPGPAALEQAVETPPMPGGSETILLVEDEDAVRTLARHILQLCGYNVIEAGNGVEALRQIKEHQGPVHLILTDVVMPGMAGRALVERLAALRPEARVLYMSGYTDDAVIRHGILEAETAFLQKPFAPHMLATKVREVLDRRG
jgi:PAS domain S-box-containing protein